ncbi:hypothetical protein MUP05_04300 [Candidatus Bathyarchaeota archaeon]|nr:hypothetical protein [Candidatus Bathyarchaeota archaeon]
MTCLNPSPAVGIYRIAVSAYLKWGAQWGLAQAVVWIGLIVGHQSWDLSVTPTSRSVPATGGSVSYTVSVTGLTTYRIHLSSTGLPASFSINDRCAPFTSIMTVTALGVPPGTYQKVVKGEPVDRAGDAYFLDPISPRSRTVQLTVLSERPRPMQPLPFGVALFPEPGTQSIRAGQSASFKINARLVYGSAPAVSLGVTDLPDNATYSFSKPSGTPPYSSDLTISTDPSTPPGTYMCNVTCSALTLLNSTSVTLIVDRFKPPSLLSITTKPNTLEEGESISVAGSLMPYLPATIQLIYRNPAGTEITRQVSTDTGNFTDTFKPDAAGDWSVKAKWAGDSDLEGSESQLVQFSVKASPLKTVLPVTVVVVAVAAALFFYLRKKRSH